MKNKILIILIIAIIFPVILNKSIEAKDIGSYTEKEIYRCHKNDYGIVWLIKEKSPFGTYYWDISDDSFKAVKRIPRYTKLNVIEQH